MADGIIPRYSKVTDDDKSCKKGLHRLIYAPCHLLLLLLRSTNGFAMLIKCSRDIAVNVHAIKGTQSRCRIEMILTDSWLKLDPSGSLCIFVVHQLQRYKVKSFKCCDV